MEDLDVEFGQSQVKMERLSDTAGVLKRKERRTLIRELELFENTFPQLFFCSHTVTLEPLTNIRQYAFWLLNRGTFDDGARICPNDGGIVLVIDVSGKSATLTHGYLLDFSLTEEVTFDILSKAHPYLLQGQYLKAISLILRRLKTLLIKESRKSGRKSEKNADSFKSDMLEQSEMPQTDEEGSEE